jgi:hypothetical protein
LEDVHSTLEHGNMKYFRKCVWTIFHWNFICSRMPFCL